MKEKEHKNKGVFVLTAFLFLGAVLALAVPIAQKAYADGSWINNNQSTFSVTFTTENINCMYYSINTSSGMPTDDGVSTVNVTFTVTDANTWADIDDSTGSVILNKEGVTRTSTSCTNDNSSSGNTKVTTCFIPMYYFDNTGTWNITVSIGDYEGVYCNETGEGKDHLADGFTYEGLYAMRLDKNSMLFNGQPTGNNVSSTNPLGIRNTGNLDYTSIDITGKNLTTATPGLPVILPENLSMTTGAGERYFASTPVAVPNITGAGDINLVHGNASHVNVNMTLYIPTGIPVGTVYNSTENWVVDAIA